MTNDNKIATLKKAWQENTLEPQTKRFPELRDHFQIHQQPAN
ncbi:MAG: hypothetical protein R2911_39115 [Caldilineaceae bacterium]